MALIMTIVYFIILRIFSLSGKKNHWWSDLSHGNNYVIFYSRTPVPSNLISVTVLQNNPIIR